MLEARLATASNRLRRGAETVDCVDDALAAPHKRIADLEREVLELRLSYSQNAVTYKAREAN